MKKHPNNMSKEELKPKFCPFISGTSKVICTDTCALYDEEKRQCSIKTIAKALTGVLDIEVLSRDVNVDW